MPFIKIQLLEGRTTEQKQIAAKKIAEIAIKELAASEEAVKVIFEEMSREDYYPGGNSIK